MQKGGIIPKVTPKEAVLTFNCTVTLVFRGFNVLAWVFFSGSLGVTSNGGLSLPSRSKTDCLLITFALFTEIKIKIQTINPGKIYLTISSFSRLLSKASPCSNSDQINSSSIGLNPTIANENNFLFTWLTPCGPQFPFQVTILTLHCLSLWDHCCINIWILYLHSSCSTETTVRPRFSFDSKFWSEFSEISSDERNRIFRNFQEQGQLREVYRNFKKFSLIWNFHPIWSCSQKSRNFRLIPTLFRNSTISWFSGHLPMKFPYHLSLG